MEKAYDRVPREELWYCMRKSGVAEKYVRVVQDMYERSRTVVRCAVGQTEEFKVEVGLHQGSALSPFLFAIVMDQLSEEVRQGSPWTMMFADDIVICSESREQVEENLERWRFALERRGMKVSRSKTEYMCVNEREGSGTVRLQGEEVKKVQEFKYLRSKVQSNGECGKEVKKRVTSSKSILLPILAVTLLLAAGRQGISYMFSKYIQVTLSKDLKNIQKTYLKAPNSCFWVAECQGRLVGTVACLPAERNEGCLELKRMSVKRTHRGMGIAKALCRAVADFAQARGFPAVIVYTSVVQTDAQKLYENMGYKKVQEFVLPELLAKITSFTLFEYRLDLQETAGSSAFGLFPQDELSYIFEQSDSDDDEPGSSQQQDVQDGGDENEVVVRSSSSIRSPIPPAWRPIPTHEGPFTYMGCITCMEPILTHEEPIPTCMEPIPTHEEPIPTHEPIPIHEEPIPFREKPIPSAWSPSSPRRKPIPFREKTHPHLHGIHPHP
ncbi:hypothetical protein QTP86_004808 [Hemibagrus guttatus]|nr:hypothetical protein QTP86_004808 [Hemibagrus guttatus]